MTDTVVAWLEAEFEQRYAKLAAVREATGLRLFRPVIELIPQDDDATVAEWPAPHLGDDLATVDEAVPLAWFDEDAAAERWWMAS